jgi:hypothetical protein
LTSAGRILPFPTSAAYAYFIFEEPVANIRPQGEKGKERALIKEETF